MASNQEMKKLSEYPIKMSRFQKIIGPIDDDYNPPQGCEVFVSRIPEDVTDVELFPFLSKAGSIHMFRLMIQDNGKTNRGFAFVTYTTAEEASTAVKKLNSVMFKDSYLSVEKSFDNCRLFVGGIPDKKNKDQVWQELIRCGFKNIVDVIMYRSYTDRALNRGFVFVEFHTHQQAAEARATFKNLRLWGQKMVIDWSTPLPEVDSDVLSQVKILFLRNLKVDETKEHFCSYVCGLLRKFHLEKIYKFKDYAFVHFETRADAEEGLQILTNHYRKNKVEVIWAIPQQFAPKKKHLSARLASIIERPTSSRKPSISSDAFSDDAFYDQFDNHHFNSEAVFEEATDLNLPSVNMTPTFDSSPIYVPCIHKNENFEVSKRTLSGSSDDSGISLNTQPKYSPAKTNAAFLAKPATTFRNTEEELMMIPNEYRPMEWIPSCFLGKVQQVPRNKGPLIYNTSFNLFEDDHQVGLISSMINTLFDE